MKHLIETLVAHALEAMNLALPEGAERPRPGIERTRDPAHGDFACNVAMQLARPLGRKPRDLAAAIVAALPAHAGIERVEIAGPGFINFFLAPAAYQEELGKALAEGSDYGRLPQAGSAPVLVEFVSANPTGPLHVGHGRQAAVGASLANLLAYAGHEVAREYYVNDAGRQMDILTVSAWIRYLQAAGEPLPFPVNGYRGDYVIPIAARLGELNGETLRRSAADVMSGLPPDETEGGDKEQYVDALIARMKALVGEGGYLGVLGTALEMMLADIREDLQSFGVEFDRWYSERELTVGGAVGRALERLRAQDHLYVKDGATWFRATAFGDEKDRVVVRDNGVGTYFASDIAYHLDKRERGFGLLLDVLGADHHGYVARVRAGLEAMGEPGDSLEVTLIQFVSLFRGSEKVPMGKREAQFVTLRQLREEVGNDACRFFYLMRSHDQPLDFDLELAKSRSNENPVFYVQYAHARVASVFRQLADRGLQLDRGAGIAALGRLDTPTERALLAALTRWPEVIELAAAQRAPHMLVHYLRELATAFHALYNAEQFIVDDPALRNARLALIEATRRTIALGLGLLGVSAPESM
ncbi:MAG: arginine--tRNA ligase [Steroidobacteraceae bacterium]